MIGLMIFLILHLIGISRWEILCPCCSNINWHTREEVKDHLVNNGFLPGTLDGFVMENPYPPLPLIATHLIIYEIPHVFKSHLMIKWTQVHDDMERLLRDALRMHNHDSDNSSSQQDIPNVQNIRAESHGNCDVGLDRQEPTDEPNVRASNFYKLLEDAK